MLGTLAFRGHRWRHSRARDAFSGLAMAVVTVGGAYGEAHPSNPADQLVNGHPVPHTPAAAILLVAVAALVLAFRGRHPAAVLAVSTAAVVTYSVLGYVNGAALLDPTVAVYAVATRLSVRKAVAAAGVTLAALMAATAANNPFGAAGGGFDLIPALIAAALFGGIAVANRRAYVASVRARVEDNARRRVDEEKLRIARELHDVVAHTMATINVQAGVAAHVLADRPEMAGEALQAIKVASKEGLRELRAILDVLRQADDADSTQPAPGLDQLDTLVAGACRAGLETVVTLAGERRPVTAEVDLAAYRIIQESLTNAIRHAGPATATVTVTFDRSDMRIEVVDTGAGAPASTGGGGTGHGLVGMRERAASVGGDLEAGPARSGGYRVRARLPLAGAQQTDPPAAATAREGAR